MKQSFITMGLSQKYIKSTNIIERCGVSFQVLQEVDIKIELEMQEIY